MQTPVAVAHLVLLYLYIHARAIHKLQRYRYSRMADRGGYYIVLYPMDRITPASLH